MFGSVQREEGQREEGAVGRQLRPAVLAGVGVVSVLMKA